eukprot:3101562-Prymnesium_polylepis.1
MLTSNFPRPPPQNDDFKLSFLSWQAHQHDALTERSSNLLLTSNFNHGEARSSSLKVEPAFAASTCTLCTPRTRLACAPVEHPERSRDVERRRSATHRYYSCVHGIVLTTVVLETTRASVTVAAFNQS